MSIQYFTNPNGYNTDAAYIRFDDDALNAEGVVVTVYGTERQPSAPFPLALILPLVASGDAKKITAEQANALVTHRSGWQ